MGVGDKTRLTLLSFSGLYAHGLANAIIPVMPTFNMQDGMIQLPYWIWVTPTLIMGVSITALRKKEPLNPTGHTDFKGTMNNIKIYL